MNYYYDQSIHFAKIHKQSIYVTKLAGFIFLVLSTTRFIELKAEIDFWQIILYSTMAIVGLIQLFLTKLYLKPFRKSGKNYIKITNESIDWKLDNDQVSMKFTEIASYSANVGQVIFEMKNHKTFVLDAYKIEDKQKFIEFKEAIKQINVE